MQTVIFHFSYTHILSAISPSLGTEQRARREHGLRLHHPLQPAPGPVQPPANGNQSGGPGIPLILNSLVDEVFFRERDALETLQLEKFNYRLSDLPLSSLHASTYSSELRIFFHSTRPIEMHSQTFPHPLMSMNKGPIWNCCPVLGAFTH